MSPDPLSQLERLQNAVSHSWTYMAMIQIDYYEFYLFLLYILKFYYTTSLFHRVIDH